MFRPLTLIIKSWESFSAHNTVRIKCRDPVFRSLTPARDNKRQRLSPKLRKRKLFPPQSYEKVLADDIKRANKKIRLSVTNRKRKSDVALGELTHTRGKPSLLGPILSSRFMEADNSSTLQ